ncbi:MAG: hypothetical protein ACJAWX_002400, partial [Algoriphagus sp.]
TRVQGVIRIFSPAKSIFNENHSITSSNPYSHFDGN